MKTDIKPYTYRLNAISITRHEPLSHKAHGPFGLSNSITAGTMVAYLREKGGAK